jgi:serine/threonine-protein kinase
LPQLSANTTFTQGDVVAGKYRVDRVLGEGGMGVVLAATHVHLDQKVALKFLLPEFVGHKEVVERFMREGRAAVKIQSEHVARVLDVGATDSGAPYMVMEYLEGEDIGQLVARVGALPVADVVGYVLEACEAIAEAHSLGIVHRDLKPANLFLARRASGRPVVKVLDFGISKIPSTTKEAGLTQAAALLGSPSYMSPEQLTAAQTVDARSDVWALGIVLYEMLTGALPFTANTMPELVGVILATPPPSVDMARADVPPGLKAAIERCLEKKADKRFANVAELGRAIAPFGTRRAAQSVERIEHVLGIEGEPFMRTEPAPPMATTGPGLGPTPAPRVDGITFTPTTSQATPPRPSAGRFVIPAVLVAAAAAAAIVFVVRGQKHPPDPTPASAPLAIASAPTAPPAGEPSASALAATPLAPVASADPQPSAVASAEASVSSSKPAKPAWMQQGMQGKFGGWPRPSSTAQPTTPPPTAPTCQVVTYYDTDGTKHFKQECH